jgi:hypothetical protein
LNARHGVRIILALGQKHRDAPHALHLLRTRGWWPSDCGTAERGYELPSSNADRHSILPRWDQSRCNVK